MEPLIAWLDEALERAHATMVGHFTKVQDDPATGMRECAPVIRAAAEISAFNRAKACAQRQGLASVVALATEEVVALASTPTRTASATEDVFERCYLAAWATLLHVTKPQHRDLAVTHREDTAKESLHRCEANSTPSATPRCQRG